MIFNSFNGFDDYEEFSGDLHKIIIEYGLEPDFILTREGEKIIVNEIWSHDDAEITANRIYEFDSFFVDLIPKEIKCDVLNEVLDIYVSEENYEEAAIIRDEIKLLN